MKKISIIMFVVAMAVGACGKKATQPAAPKPADDMGAPAPAPAEGEGTPEATPEETPAPSE